MHGANYRDGKGQVFTRKKYIKGKPQIKIAKFQGGKKAVYEYCVQLLLNEKIQIRHMAIESCRLSANKTLEKTTGEQGYYSRLRIYPHNLLRENKQIATAGADRVSEGMRRAWGKATSLGARVRARAMYYGIICKCPTCRGCKKSTKRCKCKITRNTKNFSVRTWKVITINFQN